MTDPRLPDALIAEIVRRVRALPIAAADWPEAMLVTGDELRQIIQAVLAEDAQADAPQLADLERYRAILADHAITEPDTLKHRLEDWARWHAERQDGTP